MRVSKFDNRTSDNIINQMRTLAESYTPEWSINLKTPDAGAVLLILYAGQLAENVAYFNQGPRRFRAELVNMLGISPLPPQPSSTIVRFEINHDTIPGIYVQGGIKLYTNRDSQQIVFETESSLYVTSARFQTIFMVSGKAKQVQALLGKFQPIPVIEELVEKPLFKQSLLPFKLFSSTEKGMESNALVLYHKTAFDISEAELCLDFENSPQFLNACRMGQIRLEQYTEMGLQPVNVAVDNTFLRFHLPEQNKKCGRDKAYSALVFFAADVTENIPLTSIKISSEGSAQTVEFVSNGTSDLNREKFHPFGETLNLYNEVFLGHNSCFAKAGAEVTITFGLEIKQHLTKLPNAEEADALKIIKRKTNSALVNFVPDAFVQSISLEYYNGSGWRRLDLEEEYEHLFAADRSGAVTLHFVCPADWKEQNAFGYEGRMLRMQVLKADNCYLFPCRHNYPVITQMKIGYSYQGRPQYPQKLEAISGTKKRNLTDELCAGREIVAFCPSAYTKNALYLGFDKRPEQGPVSILFELNEDNISANRTLQFEYSSPQGFQLLRVVDGTEGLKRTGCVRFLPPDNMASLTLEGKTRYWLRLVDIGSGEWEGESPLIQSILLNAVEVMNVDTLKEKTFYLDEIKPNMEFKLAQEHILDAQVWVNEVNVLSRSQMQQMLAEHPNEVRAEYNYKEEIQEFYVLWQEVSNFENFENTQSGERSYVLDRWNRSLRFGDGIHVKIPRVTEGVAIKVIVRGCNGAEGNIPARSIEGSLKNLHFVDAVTNLYAAYGGANMENTSRTLQRGAVILSGRKRLVTSQDFEREVRSFSESVDKVSCIQVHDKYCLILLMKEFEEKTRAFAKLRPKLSEHLLKKCELTMEASQLLIEEPIFVEISVVAWLQIPDENDSLQILELVCGELRRYLTPTTTKHQNGWDIGRLPRQTQIRMKLNSLDVKMRLEKLVIYAAYRDKQGKHECELEQLPSNPYFVCKSGEHEIHFISPSETRGAFHIVSAGGLS